MTQYAWLIPALPLAGFLINGLLCGRLSKMMSGIIGSGTVLAAFVLSCMVFSQMNGQTQVVTLFDFIKAGNIHIPFSIQFDPLSSLFLLIITGVGFLIHVYSTSYMNKESDFHFARYFSYLNLFIFSMLLLVV